MHRLYRVVPPRAENASSKGDMVHADQFYVPLNIAVNCSCCCHAAAILLSAVTSHPRSLGSRTRMSPRRVQHLSLSIVVSIPDYADGLVVLTVRPASILPIAGLGKLLTCSPAPSSREPQRVLPLDDEAQKLKPSPLQWPVLLTRKSVCYWRR